MPDGFYFYTPAENTYTKIPLGETAFNELLAKHPEFLKTQDVIITEYTERFLLLPDFIDQKNIKKYFDFHFKNKADYEIKSEKIEDYPAFMYWEIEKEKSEFYKKHFDNCIFYSIACKLASQSLKISNKEHCPVMIAHITDRSMCIFISKKDKIFLANSYVINKKEEIIYFIMKCLEQIKINAYSGKILLCNESNYNNVELENILSEYIKNINIYPFSKICVL